jgi:WD40 repeat protein
VRGFGLVVRDLAYSPDGAQLAVALVGSSEIWLLDVESGELLNTLEGHVFRVNGVAFSPGGGLIASAGRDSTVRLWDAETGESYTNLETHSDAVNDVTFSPAGDLLASGSDDGSVVLWGLGPP